MLVMCEKPKRMEAIHQPARSLLDARESKFWSRPRKRNSSGQAVKQRMPSENDETCGDEKAPMVAPPDGVGDAIDATQKQETSKCDVDAEEDSENVGKTAARVRPEPV